MDERIEDHGVKFQKTKEDAERGDPYAQFAMGLWFSNDDHECQDHKQTVEWYTKAAVQGHIKAQFFLGGCYGEGKGVLQDHKQAVYWYTKAAGQGHAVAQYFLAICYEEGNGILQDMNQAKRWHSKATAQGDVWVTRLRVSRSSTASLRGRKVTKEALADLLTTNMLIIANSIKQKYNLIDIKYGFNHVASSGEDFVKTMSAILGLQINNLKDNDLNYLCWIAVPIDESNYVIKVDGQKQLNKLRSDPESGIFNSADGDAARFEYMQSQTEIDDVEEVLGKIAYSRVSSGMYAIINNGVKYRRLSYLIHP